MSSISSFLNGSVFGMPIYKIMIAAAIILLFILLQKLFFTAVKKIILSLFGKVNVNIDNDRIQIMGTPVKLLFLIAWFWTASLYLKLPEDIYYIVSHAIRSVFIFLVFWSCYRLMDVLLGIISKQSPANGSRADTMLIPFMFKLIKVVLAIVGFILIIQEWNYDITTLLTGLGLGGLAFALAAQETLSNLFGSAMIMMDRPFYVGDWILAAGTEGVVEEIGFRSTKIRTFSQALVSIPNSTLSKEPVTNWSRMGKRRVAFRLGLVYGTPADRVKEFVERARLLLDKNEAVSKDTAVFFDEFGNDGLEVLFQFYTNTTIWKEYLAIKESINLQLMELLKEMGIFLAFPSRSIYLENIEDIMKSVK